MFLTYNSKWGCSQNVIAIKLGVENTTLLDSCIQFYMFTNISDIYIYIFIYIYIYL